jgi:hypothetical protein
MSLIRELIPAPRLRQVERVAVAAPPAEAWRLLRHVDIYRHVPIFRRLIALRGLPDRLRGRAAPPLARATIDDIAARSEFRVLAEEPGREVVLGAIGTFWQPTILWRQVAPDAFERFDTPGWGKVAWNLRVDPRGAGCWVTCEVRVTVTSDDAWPRFQRYWRIIGRFSHGVRRAFLSSVARELGVPGRDPLPGDDLLPGARFERTHAVTIEAPPARVWPWLVQMGGRRAGWYSIDWLDNRGRRSAERVVPELQALAVGDRLPFTPGAADGFVVERLEPERALVLSAASPGRSTSWAFALSPIGDDATELEVRARGTYPPGVKAAAGVALVGAAHEVMERAQLRNLKRRVEATRPSV